MRRLRLIAFAATVAVFAGCTGTVIDSVTPPPTPADLQATLISPRSVRLSWSGTSTGGFSVYRNDMKIGDATATEFVDSTFAGSSTYTWFVVARGAGGQLSKPSDPVTMGFGDISAPTVTTTSISSGASNVSRLASPSFTFSEDMIPISVMSGGITARITSTSEPVYGSVNYDPATRKADFWPFFLLPARTSITVSVTTLAKDLAGNSAVPLSMNFTTGDTPASISELPAHEEVLLVSAGDLSFSPRELFKMRADGTGRVNITNNPGSDLHGSWSRDGRHVVFASDRNGTYDIYVMRDDGTGLRQLTFDPKDQTQPRWSADGRRIVYISTRDGVPPPGFSTPADIWAMNADGSSQSVLISTPQVYESWPEWSPDGKYLLYKRDSVGGADNAFWIANADGTQPGRLRAAMSAFSDDRAAWSPDGTQIAFSAFDFAASNQFHDQYDLYVMNADGSSLRRVTRYRSPRFPAWSPDGRSLLFSISGDDEFWARFGKIGAAIVNIETGAIVEIAPQTPPTEVMSPQAWRR
jgi:Tol biopolymer transport system component